MANFASMLARLLDMISYRIHNGELTERGLARACGISQPHIHHLVKGKRQLSPASADKLLDTLGWSADDLLIDPDVSAGANFPERHGTFRLPPAPRIAASTMNPRR